VDAPELLLIPGALLLIVAHTDARDAALRQWREARASEALRALRAGQRFVRNAEEVARAGIIDASLLVDHRITITSACCANAWGPYAEARTPGDRHLRLRANGEVEAIEPDGCWIPCCVLPCVK
jgi:hypothetical protein